jgi:Domain of unknown function (DUF1911)
VLTNRANQMTEAAFREKRRQKYLTEKYFELNKKAQSFLTSETLKALPARKAAGDLDAFGEGGMFKDMLKGLRLHYTAGESIESLRPLYANAAKWFGEWHVAYALEIQAIAKERGSDLRTDGTPVHFEDLFHFQLAIDLVSLGILLGEANAVRKIAAWLTRYRGDDMLFESLLEPVVADPHTEVDEFFHEEPYDPLLDAIFTAETPAQASAFVKKYLDGWYKAFEGVPWHNGHLVVTDEYMAYEGYWAFEAAAVCVIHNIDDSSFRDHIVYPKDLADWAREHKVMDKIKPAAGAKPLRLRCEAKQPCPQAGYWFTTAMKNSRRQFEAGEKMPNIKESPWGATIWYWDQQQ